MHLSHIDNLYLSVLKSRLVLTDTNHLDFFFYFKAQPQSSPAPPLCVCSGTGCESVVCAELRGDSRGAASSRSHTVLLQALQRPRPFTASSQHSLRFQGEPGNRPAGGFQTNTQGTVPQCFFTPRLSFIDVLKGANIDCLCHQGTSGPDPSTVYVDMKSLRHDRSDWRLTSSPGVLLAKPTCFSFVCQSGWG